MKHKSNKNNKDLRLISLYFSNLHHKLRNYILDDPHKLRNYILDDPTIDRYLVSSTGGNYYNL